ncbi:MAG: ABC transporter permease, partial [Planctomycetes bacterium]|nr:ABC transporter permease [Planctomycetota bacterium]
TREPKPWRVAPKRQEMVQVFGVYPEQVSRVIPFREMIEDVRDRQDPGVPDMKLRMPERFREEIFWWFPGDEMTQDDREPGIVLGSKLAEKLSAEVGDVVTLYSAKLPEGDDIDPNDVDIKNERFRVTGCFQSGRYEYDSAVAFVHGSDLEFLGRAGANCDEVRVRLSDPALAAGVKEEILEKWGRDLGGISVMTWEDRMANLAAALKFEKLAMLVVLSCIIAVAGACIGGILYMVVLEKTRDIGIVLSMGATSSGVVGVFLAYGGMLGLLGILLGVLLGTQVVDHLNEIIRWIERIFDLRLFPPEVYQFQGLPTWLSVPDTVRLAVYTFAWCLVASMLPAIRAARLDPLRSLVYE